MSPREQLVALKTMVVREILRFMRIWIQTLFPPAITTALYFVIFGELIGSQIADIDGRRYIDYITPGLILMAVISNAYANAVSSFYSSKFQRNIEEMLVSPMPGYIILLGFTAGGVARGVVVGLIVFGVALFFTSPPLENPWLALGVLLLTATLFSIAGVINGVFARSFDDISVIPTFVLVPLTYLGGVFYSIDMLPPFWRELSLANPIFYMIDAFRHGMLGAGDLQPQNSVLMILAFIAALGGAALYLIEKGVRLK